LMSRSVKSGLMSASKLVSLVIVPREGLLILRYGWFLARTGCEEKAPLRFFS
jgi:hypothetical protein